ncbi:MAG: class I SAM-dependent methyltransferase [Bacteroidetes bacterium]|nr:MAG: class I SAM-dependent methyltransferase [Bacteroidota bacterium]
MLRKLYYLFSPSQRLMVRRLAFLPYDIWDSLTGKRNNNIPPRGMIFTGAGDFINAGKLFLEFFRQYGELKPHHRVLDVGSGIGRMALPLTTFLSEEGSYEGFDIVNTGVKWCQKNISTHHPNFNFKLIALKNDLYSSEGDEAAELKFPYNNEEFDFVFLTSVFTHMVPSETKNYMKEISRVLKPSGKCLATFFVFDYQLPSTPIKPSFGFPVDHGYYKLMDPRVKSANVAFKYDYIEKELAHDNKLRIKKFVPGYWQGLEKNKDIDFQDILVFEKV